MDITPALAIVDRSFIINRQMSVITAASARKSFLPVRRLRHGVD